MTQLIQDVFIIENLQVLSEGKNGGKTIVKGIFGRCNETNKNGRLYPTAVLEGQLKKVQPLIEERRLCGELDHPSNDTVKLSNASHLITKLEMKGDELIGEAEILGTPAGLTAKALIEAGVCIGISSRGMGTLSEDANGKKVVNDDFRLVTFDLVADPSTRGAFPALAESTESRFARTSQNKLTKEQNFVTMLQEKLRESYDPWIEEARRVKKRKAKKKGFPDLNKDGKITRADILVGRGVIPGRKMKMEAVKNEGSWHQIAEVLAEGLGLITVEANEFTGGDSDSDSSNKAPSGRAVRRIKSAAGARERAAKAERSASVAARRATRERRAEKGQGIRGALSRAGAGAIDKTAKTVGDAATIATSPIGGAAAVVKNRGERYKQFAQSKMRRAATKQASAEQQVKDREAENIKRNKAAEKKKTQDAIEDSTVYKQIGFHLAEAFGLVEAKLPRVRDTLRQGYDQHKAAMAARKKESEREAAAEAKPENKTPEGRRRAREYGRRKDVVAGREAARAAGRNKPAPSRMDYAHTEYKQIGFALAEAFGLVEMRDMTIADQEARAEQARKSSWRAGKKPKSDVMGQYTGIQNKIQKRLKQKEEQLEKMKSKVKRPRRTDQGGEDQLTGIGR